MIIIDGSKGEGGGQIIRTSLALSMITGKPFEVRNVRGGRANPGLARQHLTCLLAAQEVSDANVLGAHLKSSHIQFEPKSIRAGNYQFSIGTAGSTSLVAQTVLPALLTAKAPSQITIEGGTHNHMAPPFDFLKHAFLKLINQMGPEVNISLEAYGFYPAGGGKICLNINPTNAWQGLRLLERSKVTPFVTAIVSDLPTSIGKRECDTICRKADWPSECSEIVDVENPRGPGNVVLIRLATDTVDEVFSGIGQVGVKAEQVARKVLKSARSYLSVAAPIGPHLADQIMLPMAIAAMQGQESTFRTVPLTQHSQTHIEIINLFLDINMEVKELDNSMIEIRIHKA